MHAQSPSPADPESPASTSHESWLSLSYPSPHPLPQGARVTLMTGRQGLSLLRASSEHRPLFEKYILILCARCASTETSPAGPSSSPQPLSFISRILSATLPDTPPQSSPNLS